MAQAPKPAKHWSELEDRVLQTVLAQYAHIPGRNNKECRKRWRYALMPTVKKGAWSNEEDQLLREGVRQFQFKWAQVALVVKTRQPDQCARRWRESANPNINHGRWSIMEDQILKEAVQVYGRRWTEIVERYFPDRTPIAAKNRYIQRFENKGKSRGSDADDADDGSSGSGSSSSNGGTAETPEPAGSEPSLLWFLHDHSQTPQPQLTPGHIVTTTPSPYFAEGSDYFGAHIQPYPTPPVDHWTQFHQPSAQADHYDHGASQQVPPYHFHDPCFGLS